MKNIYYDFHIHTCLSPCGDMDMTPNNIVNMAKLKELDAIAVTDHNACGNCGAVMRAGEKAGLLVLPGMELCTQEDIHCLCLFETLAGALEFEKYIRPKIPVIKNRPDIFGPQVFMDEDDNETGSEDILLINAAAVGVDKIRGIALEFGGTALPAHADKEANGIIAMLGSIPPEAGFKTIELSSGCDGEKFLAENNMKGKYNVLRDSDAHYLWQISERNNFINTEEISTQSIIKTLNSEKKA